MSDDGMACRGLRGAITVNGEGSDAVRDATVELLEALVAMNGCRVEDIAAVIFTVPDDLVGSNPPAAARMHGWDRVRSEEHTSELQSRENLVCRLLLEKKKK